MIRVSVLLFCLVACGCSTLKLTPKVGVTYDLFSNQAKFEFSLAPGSKGKNVAPLEK